MEGRVLVPAPAICLGMFGIVSRNAISKVVHFAHACLHKLHLTPSLVKISKFH